MKSRLGWLVAVAGAGAIALSAAAQGSSKLAVGPDAGGYLCPDGRQLYVKSCYDNSPGSTCGVVYLDKWTSGAFRFQVEAIKARPDLLKDIDGCKLYPVAFRNGEVSLVLPKSTLPQSTAKGPAATPTPGTSTTAPPSAGGDTIDLTVADGMAYGQHGVPSSLVRISPVNAASRIFYVDEASRRATGQKDVMTIWSLMAYVDGKPPVAGASAVWVENNFNCKLNSFSQGLFVLLDRQATILVIDVSGESGTVAKTSVQETILGIACKPTQPIKGSRFASAKAAIADAFSGAAPTIAAKPAMPAAKALAVALPAKAPIRLPKTETEKLFFRMIKESMFQAAINAFLDVPESERASLMKLTDEQGMTALHWAAANRSANMTRWLVDKNANPDLADQEGRTPLRIAIDNTATRVMTVLLNIGHADANLAWPGHANELNGFKETDDLVEFLIKNAASPKN